MSHYNWIVYPEGKRRLDESGLTERIKVALKEPKISLTPYHYYNPEEFLSFLEHLKEGGYLAAMPFDFVKNFGEDIYQDWHQGLRRIVDKASKEENAFWNIERRTGENLELVYLDEDFPIISGFNATATLDPQSFWDFKKFEFASLGDFLGTVGAFIRMQSKAYMERGPSWSSTEKGLSFKTQVTASEHGDFILKKTDITPYTTRDPLGTLVNYRPETSQDINFVLGSSNVEPFFLAMVLKWADQEKLESRILKDPQQFLERFRLMPQYCGPFGDFGVTSLFSIEFSNWEIPVPKLNQPLQANSRFNPWGIFSPHSRNFRYTVRVGTNQELVFFQEVDGKEEDTILDIQANDLDNLIESLFLQTQMGLGRTSKKQLTDILKMYFSGEYKRNQ